VRTGHSLIQLLIALVILGILAAIAVPGLAAWRDRAAVHDARIELAVTLAAARTAAIARGERIAVAIDSAAGRVVVASDSNRVAVRPLQSEFGVTLSATRDTVSLAPNGQGYGATNTTVILRRGGHADTVTISRLGRVR
jgi:Tfp pilus assembly protein FimT